MNDDDDDDGGDGEAILKQQRFLFAMLFIYNNMRVSVSVSVSVCVCVNARALIMLLFLLLLSRPLLSYSLCLMFSVFQFLLLLCSAVLLGIICSADDLLLLNSVAKREKEREEITCIIQ